MWVPKRLKLMWKTRYENYEYATTSTLFTVHSTMNIAPK